MPTSTRAALRQALLEALGEYRSLTTSSGGSTTTLVDLSLKNFAEADDGFPGWWVLLTSGAANGEEGRILGSGGLTQSSGTLTVAEAFSATVAISVTYELSKYQPANVHAAINAGIRASGSLLYLPLRDQSLVVNNILTDGGSRGPSQATHFLGGQPLTPPPLRPRPHRGP